MITQKWWDSTLLMSNWVPKFHCLGHCIKRVKSNELGEPTCWPTESLMPWAPQWMFWRGCSLQSGMSFGGALRNLSLFIFLSSIWELGSGIPQHGSIWFGWVMLGRLKIDPGFWFTQLRRHIPTYAWMSNAYDPILVSPIHLQMRIWCLNWRNGRGGAMVRKEKG